ncbi:uncharacterized protein LOC111369503 isoform X2 [Olea europaea var. sylvestris]|nr:uncharacterized protein LOC111369503 isoform X2 [Olea europaea var. sylvestris]
MLKATKVSMGGGCCLCRRMQMIVSISFKWTEVPSFLVDVAMALIEEELGQQWCNIYSELSSSLIAIANYSIPRPSLQGPAKRELGFGSCQSTEAFVLETSSRFIH